MSSLSKSLLSVLESVCLWPARAASARRDLALLASLDDRGLADIGLIRQDLRDATAFSLFEDPTAHLAARARERAEAALATRIVPPPRTPPCARTAQPHERAAA
jgi:uncharacterized protein YjiS (DUF1127 family)